MKQLEKVARYVVLGLFGFIIAYLLLLSLFSTSFVNPNELVYYVADRPFVTLLLLFLLLAGLALVLKKCKAPAFLSSRWLPLALGAAGAIAATVWVLCTQPVQNADQQMVLDIAAALRAGDGGALKEGGYLDMFSQQVGYVLVLYLVSFLTGPGNVLAIQLLNVPALVLCWYALYRLYGLWFHTGKRQNLFLALTLLFLPLGMYATFAYANLWGLALALAGGWQLARYHQSPSWGSAVCGVMLLSLATLMKSNALIFLVAAVILLVADAIFYRRWHPVAVALSLPLAYWLLGRIAHLAIEAIAGLPLGSGIPMTAWLAMGLQESARAPGWFNTYPDSAYIIAGYDPAVVNEMAWASIRERLADFFGTPFYALQFFGRKTASQWNDPTFQGLWVTMSKEAGIAQPAWVLSLLYGKGALALMAFLNFFQSAVWFGTLAWAVCKGKNASLTKLSLAVVFIGGFLFHLVWEAKGQYTLAYFLVILPYAAEGWLALAGWLGGLPARLKATPRPARAKALLHEKAAVMLAGLVLAVGLVAAVDREVLHVTFKLGDDTAAFSALVEEYKTK